MRRMVAVAAIAVLGLAVCGGCGGDEVVSLSTVDGVDGGDAQGATGDAGGTDGSGDRDGDGGGGPDRDADGGGGPATSAPDAGSDPDGAPSDGDRRPPDGSDGSDGSGDSDGPDGSGDDATYCALAVQSTDDLLETYGSHGAMFTAMVAVAPPELVEDWRYLADSHRQMEEHADEWEIADEERREELDREGYDLLVEQSAVASELDRDGRARCGNG